MRTLVIPKVDHEDHLARIGEEITHVIQSNSELLHQRPGPISIVASIESAQALWRINEISQWRSKHGHLSAVLVRLKWLSVAICRRLTLTHPSLRLKIVRKTAHAYWLTGQTLHYRLRGHTNYPHTIPPRTTVYTFQTCGSSEGFWPRRDRYGELLSDPRARDGLSLAGLGLR